MRRRTIITGLVLGIIVGGVLSLTTDIMLIISKEQHKDIFLVDTKIRRHTLMHWKTTIVRTLMVILGIIVGGVLAVITTFVLIGVEAYSIQTTVNGWSTTLKCDIPGNGILLRAACSSILPMANVPQEAVYWTTTKDNLGQRLSSQHDYVLHFAPGGTPPNNAFWSLTMTDVSSRMIANPINRYSVGDTSGLVPNADGSIDIYIQSAAPAGHESNWLPAPTGNFKLWLRAYLPGAAILDGKYNVPPVIKVK